MLFRHQKRFQAALEWQSYFNLAVLFITAV